MLFKSKKVTNCRTKIIIQKWGKGRRRERGLCKQEKTSSSIIKSKDNPNLIELLHRLYTNSILFKGINIEREIKMVA